MLRLDWGCRWGWHRDVMCATCRRTLGQHEQRKNQQKSFQHIREYGCELVHEMAKEGGRMSAAPPLLLLF
jgi:hypothetical protein